MINEYGVSRQLAKSLMLGHFFGGVGEANRATSRWTVAHAIKSPASLSAWRIARIAYPLIATRVSHLSRREAFGARVLEAR